MDHRTAPNFRPPQIIDSPEVDVSLHNKAYVTTIIIIKDVHLGKELVTIVLSKKHLTF